MDYRSRTENDEMFVLVHERKKGFKEVDGDGRAFNI